MDLEILISVIVIIGLIVVMYFLYKNDKKDKLELEKKLDNDEYLFDPVTGKKYTIEEAEAGINMDGLDEDGIMPNHLIEASFDEDEREYHYVRNHIIRSKFEAISFDYFDKFEELILNLEIFQGYDFENILFISKVCENGFIAACNLTYSIQGGKYADISSENQLIGIIEGKPIGRSIIEPFNVSSFVKNRLTPEKEMVIEGCNVTPYDRLNEKNLNLLCRQLKKLKGGFIAQTTHKSIFIRVRRKLALNDFKTMVDVVKRYTEDGMGF